MDVGFGPILLGQFPGIIFLIALVLFLALHGYLKWPLPAAFLTIAFVSAILSGFGIPFRQLVEGEFGFLNLALVLFAGAFFGHMMRVSGAADAAAAGVVHWTGGRSWLVLLAVGIPIYVVGMFSGLSGVAILSAGVFAVAALRRIGYDNATIAGFIAVIGVAGMVAPPTNVPAMLLSDGVNMPWEGITKVLLVLSLPPALIAVVWFAWWGATKAPVVSMENHREVTRRALVGMIPLAVIVVIWVVTRWFGTTLIDPVSPLVLVIGGICAIPIWLKPVGMVQAEMSSEGETGADGLGGRLQKAVMNTFTGTPLVLAGVLMTVGVVVQVAALTGVQGWLVISIMSLPYPWNLPSLLIGMPLLGGALTAIEASDILGVPAAFSYIGQNMILNVSAISSIGALAEFVAPTSIAAALSIYLVGGGTVRAVIRRAWFPMAIMVIIALLILVKEIPPSVKNLLL